MSGQEEKSITLYDGKAFGHEVSEYALKNGYLDYLTLSKIVGDCILNNNIFEYAGYENWWPRIFIPDDPHALKPIEPVLGGFTLRR